jgi:serine/threonine protein kinase
MRAQQGEKPLLDGLTADEQPLVRKALSANPAKRFPNCVEFIRALRRAFQQMTPAAKPPPTGRKAPPPAAGRELVPGYRLVRLLGQGTFGQVWEATGPGGVTLALKIIENLHESASQQEYRALEVIRGVEHKYLMEITAYWILDAYGQVIPDELRDRPGAPAPATLVIASRLARGHLGQRLKDCLAQTGQGIPLRELLRYMDQAARAIDFMNKPQHLLDGKPIAIQHRDIKPENILLSANNDVKIADFGLAKVVEGISSIIHTKSMGLTPYYAPPELFRNEVTRWSDQYSLAVTYAQLRAGSLPFPAVRSLTEIMRIHLEGRLDLSRLPAPEAEVIRKATAVKAEERYPTCRDMVKALVAACADELAALPPTGSFKPVSFDEPASDLAPPPPAAADLPPPVPVDQLNLDTLPAARLGRATPAGGTAVPTEVPDEADHPTGEGLLGKMKNWFWGKKGPGP